MNSARTPAMMSAQLSSPMALFQSIPGLTRPSERSFSRSSSVTTWPSRTTTSPAVTCTCTGSTSLRAARCAACVAPWSQLAGLRRIGADAPDPGERGLGVRARAHDDGWIQDVDALDGRGRLVPLDLAQALRGERRRVRRAHLAVGDDAGLPV